jgi:two-component SAPR family response regulator
MNCIIIDDEEMASYYGPIHFKEYRYITIENEFSNALQAIKYLNQNHVDLIFLIFICLILLVLIFQTIKDPPKVILVTSDKNFAMKHSNMNV